MNYVNYENMQELLDGIARKIGQGGSGALIGDTTPVGTVISFMGTQAPLFYLVCDGTTYNIAEYQELADFIEAQFGAVNFFGGDGITTFAVPDLRGEFLRGTGANSHTNQGSGSNVGSHQNATSIPYIGIANTGIVAQDIPGSNGTETLPQNFDSSYYLSPGAKVGKMLSFGSGSWAYDSMGNVKTVRPTNTSVLYCIKYTKAVIPSEYEDGTPVGRVIFDSILREGYIKANGAQIEDASISIPRLLSFVQKYSSQLIASDQATYEANVGLYMYDSNNDILTLPNYIGRFLEGGNSVTSIEAGLPNIKGAFIVRPITDTVSRLSAVIENTTGCIQKDGITDNVWGSITPAWSTQYRANKFNLDASQSNQIYSDSVDTVQPSAITLIPQIRY